MDLYGDSGSKQNSLAKINIIPEFQGKKVGGGLG